MIAFCTANRAGDGVNRAGEVGDDAVPGGVEDAAAMSCDQPVDDEATGFEPGNRADFVAHHLGRGRVKTLEAVVKEGRMRVLILGAALAAAATPALAEFTLSSTNVKSGSPMALEQVLGSCNGQNVSPALTWSGEPADTQSFALTMVDADAQNGRGWWHWSVFNIPASVHGLAAGAGSEGSKDLPAGAVQGRTDFGFSHYGGPCPPVGDHAHHYEITIYALKVPSLPLDETASGAQVGPSLGANTLATAKIVGRYGRSE